MPPSTFPSPASIQAASTRYRLSTTAALTLTLLPFLLTLLLSLFSRPLFYDLHPYLWGEGKIVETAQFLFLLIAAAQGLLTCWRAAVLRERHSIRLFYLIFALAMLFIAGEEVAWGQQFFNFRTPAFLQVFNTQNELTFHNFGALQARSDLLNLLFALAGLAAFPLAARPRWRTISTPILLLPWLGLVLALALFGIGFDLALGGQPLNYPAQYVFHIQTETAELLIALVGMLYPWLKRRRYFHLETGANAFSTAQVLPPSLGIFPLKPAHFRIASLSGLASMLWLIAIPGEAGSVFLFGLSRARLGMVAAGFGLLLLMLLLHWRARTDPAWRERTSCRINRLLLTPTALWALALLAGLVFLAAFSLWITAYTQISPSLAPILARLAPWLAWLLILSCQVLSLAVPRLLPLTRSRLPRPQ